ncbi:MAG TPA: hypothetical protein PLX17_00585 [Chitinophagaceae bacterium]|nr:hypothetical protein [Chitinophagaceae bacterium]
MKFKILKGTELYNQLVALRKKIDHVQSESAKLAKEFGGGEVATSGRNLAGGIDAVEFKEKPEGWKVVGETWQKLFYPKSDKSNKEIHEKIQALPVVKFEELNSLVKFDIQGATSGRGLAFVKSVACAWGKGYVLIEVHENCKYTPVEGMIEILESEYKKLMDKIKD